MSTRPNSETSNRVERVAFSNDLSLGVDELRFTFTRSGGPGGQNVNKVNTRVTLHFDLAASESLSDTQKARIAHKLETRITRDGILRVVASRHRTQIANRRATIERLAELLTQALHVEKPRKKKRISAAAKRRRRDEKARKSKVKELRRSPRSRDD